MLTKHFWQGEATTNVTIQQKYMRLSDKHKADHKLVSYEKETRVNKKRCKPDCLPECNPENYRAHPQNHEASPLSSI